MNNVPYESIKRFISVHNYFAISLTLDHPESNLHDLSSTLQVMCHELSVCFFQPETLGEVTLVRRIYFWSYWLQQNNRIFTVQRSKLSPSSITSCFFPYFWCKIPNNHLTWMKHLVNNEIFLQKKHLVCLAGISDSHQPLSRPWASTRRKLSVHCVWSLARVETGGSWEGLVDPSMCPRFVSGWMSWDEQWGLLKK